jgi:outer membrane PBP1 activator LpoA protein
MNQKSSKIVSINNFQRLPQMIKSSLHTLFIIAIALLTACGSQPTVITDPTVTTLPPTQQIQQLLSEIDTARSPQREQKQLQVAQLLIEQQQWELAEQMIRPINQATLSLEDLASYIDVQALLAIHYGKYQAALTLLDNEQLINNSEQLPPATQLNISLRRAEVYALLGDHMASAQQRIFIAPLLNADQLKSNQQSIWDSLMYVSAEDLSRYRDRAFSQEYRGWLELALIAKDNQGDLDQQLQQLEQWQQQWLNHPANQTLPGGLELIKELAANRPQQIALLLPLTGKLAPLGKAVRDGFIAELYATQNRGGKVPVLKIYDTEQSDNFLALYNQSIIDGAEMIVGPLEKHRVRLLFDEIISVPTLALNRVDDYGVPPEQLFQFGLSPNDEAIQVAEIAFLENHKRAMIISPIGEWGEKVSASFTERWQQLGGTVATNSIYSGQADYSKTVKDSLLLQNSEDRAKRIRTLVGEPIEFLPRRREDVDMVFMLAGPQQARSLKPLLAYHYASDLPVYGTSRLYSGTDDEKDRDINNVRFTDMPWVLEKSSSLHTSISNNIKFSDQHQRLYALGIDSYQLHPRLRQLLEIPNSRVYGQTGTLKLNAQRQIERQMLFAKIKNSKAETVPIAAHSLDLSNSSNASDTNESTMEGDYHVRQMDKTATPNNG